MGRSGFIPFVDAEAILAIMSEPDLSATSAYQPPPTPTTPPSAAASADRPVAVTVLGILHQVFGGLGIFGTAIGLAALLLMPSNANIPNPALDLMKESSTYAAYMWGSSLIGIVLAVLQCLGGFWLFRRRAKGRKLLLVVCGVVILFGPLSAGLNVYLLMTEGGMASQSPAAMGGFIGGIMGSLIGLILPILTIVFLIRPNIKASMIH